jgi:hypothetical protein
VKKEMSMRPIQLDGVAARATMVRSGDPHGIAEPDRRTFTGQQWKEMMDQNGGLGFDPAVLRAGPSWSLWL